jgi:hypothetical protein
LTPAAQGRPAKRSLARQAMRATGANISAMLSLSPRAAGWQRHGLLVPVSRLCPCVCPCIAAQGLCAELSKTWTAEAKSPAALSQKGWRPLGRWSSWVPVKQSSVGEGATPLSPAADPACQHLWTACSAAHAQSHGSATCCQQLLEHVKALNIRRSCCYVNCASLLILPNSMGVRSERQC